MENKVYFCGACYPMANTKYEDWKFSIVRTSNGKRYFATTLKDAKEMYFILKHHSGLYYIDFASYMNKKAILISNQCPGRSENINIPEIAKLEPDDLTAIDDFNAESK